MRSRTWQQNPGYGQPFCARSYPKQSCNDQAAGCHMLVTIECPPPHTTLCRHLHSQQFAFSHHPLQPNPATPKEKCWIQRFAAGPAKIELKGARPGENLAKFPIGGNSEPSRCRGGFPSSEKSYRLTRWSPPPEWSGRSYRPRRLPGLHPSYRLRSLGWRRRRSQIVPFRRGK